MCESSRRAWLVVLCLLVSSTAAAQVVTTPGVRGNVTAPLFGVAADNCSTPPYSFLLSTTTGLCAPATGSWGLRAAGANVLTGTSSTVTSTVPILTPDGSAAAPAYSFANFPSFGTSATTNILFFSENGSSRASVDASGSTRQFTLEGINLAFSSGSAVRGNSADVFLTREAANHLIQRNSTAAQRASWANTYTSSTNNELFSVDWQTQANNAVIGTRTAATGTSRPLFIGSQVDNGTDAFAAVRLQTAAAPYVRLDYFTTAGAGLSTAATGNWFQVGGAYTNTATSGTNAWLAILPTYNQTSGTAANTDLLINRTQTAVGSGAQLLIDAQVGSVSQFSVTNQGAVVTNGSVTLPAGGTFGFSGRNGWSSGANGLTTTTDTAGAFGIQINTGTAAPTFNNGTVTTGSRNTAGQITLTGGNTGGVITFGSPNWTNAPFCTLTGSAATDIPQITAVTTSTLTVAGFTANGVFTYICIGRI